MLKAGVEAEQSIDAQFFWEELQWLVHKLGFSPGENGIVINGRVSLLSFHYQLLTLEDQQLSLSMNSAGRWSFPRLFLRSARSPNSRFVRARETYHSCCQRYRALWFRRGET